MLPDILDNKKPTEGDTACRLAAIPAAISIQPNIVPAYANPYNRAAFLTRENIKMNPKFTFKSHWSGEMISVIVIRLA